MLSSMGTSQSRFLTMNRMIRLTRARNQWFSCRTEFQFPPDGNRQDGLGITMLSHTPGYITEVSAGFMSRSPIARGIGYIVNHLDGCGLTLMCFRSCFEIPIQAGCIWIRVMVHYGIMIIQYPGGWLLSEIKSFRVFEIL